MLVRVALLGAWVWLLEPSGLFAQNRLQSAPQPAVAETSPLAQARKHFRLGVSLFEQRSFRDAAREFRAAAELAPNADIWFNIGRAYEELGEYQQAAEALEHYLRDRVSARDEPSVRAHISELSELARRTRERLQVAPDHGSLRIHARDRAALVFVDGEPQDSALLQEPLMLRAGRHRLDVIEPDRIPLHAQVEIQPGLLTAAYADQPPLSRVRTLASPHAYSYVLLGVASAAASTGLTFGALSAARQADASLPSARDWAARADITLAGAAVCALSAALLYFVEERGTGTEITRARTP
jgi:tetratricopeptide (TPR) repeat protein